MTSRERVLTAFARQEPDRVPLDYAANPGIDKRLKVHFHLKENDDEGLLRALGTDFRYTYRPNYIGPKLFEDKPGCIVNEWAVYCRWIEHETGGYWDYCEFPLKDAALEEIENWPMPSPDHYDYAGFAAECRRDAADGNLGGARRTLDSFHGNLLHNKERKEMEVVPEEPGFLSRDGWALVDESTAARLSRQDSGRVWPRAARPGTIDCYLLFHGRDYRGAAKRWCSPCNAPRSG